MRYLLVVFLSVSALSNCPAQSRNEKIVFYNSDSILSLMPEYQAVQDSLIKFGQYVANTSADMEADYLIKVLELREDSAQLSAEEYAKRAAELNALKLNKEVFVAAMSIESKILDSTMVIPLENKVKNAAMRAAKAKGYKEVYEKPEAEKKAARPGSNCVLVDITDLVIRELKLPVPPSKNK